VMGTGRERELPKATMSMAIRAMATATTVDATYLVCMFDIDPYLSFSLGHTPCRYG